MLIIIQQYMTKNNLLFQSDYERSQMSIVIVKTWSRNHYQARNKWFLCNHSDRQ